MFVVYSRIQKLNVVMIHILAHHNFTTQILKDSNPPNSPIDNMQNISWGVDMCLVSKHYN
jgi:hypothetical protein